MGYDDMMEIHPMFPSHDVFPLEFIITLEIPAEFPGPFRHANCLQEGRPCSRGVLLDVMVFATVWLVNSDLVGFG